LRVGFYLTGSQQVEVVLPQIARAAMGQGQRLLVVAEDAALRDALDMSLWEGFPQEFLAHGQAGGEYDARQPILLSTTCDATNDAQIVALADGKWREEASSFDRALLFFDNAGRAAAREAWRLFDTKEDVEREFFEFEAGKWVKRA
jgi:DNA polymerase-3 subunit chi